jgi:hypothetical protein
MCALLGRRVAIQMTTIFLVFQMVSGGSTSLAGSADFEIPLKELPAPASKGYEIPLSNLTKGERKKPKKPVYKDHKEKKKSGQVEQGVPQPASVSSVESAQTQSSARETNKDVAPAAQPLQKPVMPGKEQKTSSGTGERSATTTPEIVIIHDPFSYVVTGKPTIISAVIISPPGALQSVRCRFRSAETGGYAHVVMKKATETHYTYTATLPPLAQDSGSLRYSIIATDALNKETRSQEFVTQVRATSVVPGWQVETSQGNIKVWLEDPPNPLVGFSDIIVEDTVRP